MILSRQNNLPLLAAWDASNSGSPDAGVSTSNKLGDASGTHTNYVLLTEFDGARAQSSGQITITAIGKNLSNTQVFSATATYWIDSTRNWSDTPYSASLPSSIVFNPANFVQQSTHEIFKINF